MLQLSEKVLSLQRRPAMDDVTLRRVMKSSEN